MMYYSASMNTLDESLMNAVKEGKLLESSRTNIRLLLDGRLLGRLFPGGMDAVGAQDGGHVARFQGEVERMEGRRSGKVEDQTGRRQTRHRAMRRFNRYRNIGTPRKAVTTPTGNC